MTPFVVVDGKDEPGDKTFTITRAGDGWSVVLVAPHGMFPIAGLDPSLRPLLEHMQDGAELPFICRMLPDRPRNILNTVAVRLSINLPVLERVASQLPDALVHQHEDLLVARFWDRKAKHDEPGALSDFHRLLAGGCKNMDSFWLGLPPASRAASAPALKVWLQSRDFGLDGDVDGDSDPNDLPNGLNPNRLYKLPIELWPDHALADAVATARLTRSLVFFPELTYDVLLAETNRRSGNA